MRSVLVGVLGSAWASAAVAEVQYRAPLDSDRRPLASIWSISDQGKRLRALFGEIAKVRTHPRCINCHPAGEHPLQGADHHAHMPPVWRGEGGAGIAGLSCSSCHTEKNVTLMSATFQSIPGHPRWGLAPCEMNWEGKSLARICQQIKDSNRNGGRTLTQLQEHLAHDHLVAWGWSPDAGREPAPGTQEQLGELAQAWIEAGAKCPN